MKIIFYVMTFLLHACNFELADNGNSVNQQSNKSDDISETESSMISFSYEIYGKPRLNEVVTVNINTQTNNYNKPIVISYRINIIDDLVFADEQVRQLTLNQLSNGKYPVQQINVIPKRAGRVYLVISGEVTMNGSIISKSTAIPIDVE
tara:strand:+ start:152 stop:598 length:447 start_codon:yes stop_codon:yes gene_type:complete